MQFLRLAKCQMSDPQPSSFFGALSEVESLFMPYEIV